MKKNLKKLFALGCTAALTLTTAGCSSSTSSNASEADTTTETSQEASADKKIYNVAIVKQLDHASLDEIANAVEAELDKIAEDNNVAIYYELYSGQNDQTTLKQIGDQAVADGVDAEAAELTGIDYVTGTSDALNTEKIMDMMFAANPDVKNVGLLYSLSEANSTKPIADAKAYLDEKGISYTEQTANTNDEVITAASSLVADKVDAVFTPTDNVIMAAELAIFKDLADAGIPHYAGADSFVRNGAFATCGVNYTALGTQTADLAYQAITEGMDGMEDYYTAEGGIVTVNTETAEALNIDTAVFKDFGDVVEVTTTED